MASNLVLRQPDLSSPSPSAPSSVSTLPSYWNEENHNSSSSLRIENWKTPEIASHCLPSLSHETIPLSSSMINSILKYYEELKMYAAIQDQDNQQSNSSPPPILSMENPEFLDYHWNRIQFEWKAGMRREWLDSFHELESQINDKIATVFHQKALFIKLSVRSPKDAIFNLQSTYDKISQAILHPSSPSQLPLPLDDPHLLHENIFLLKKISHENLCVRNGEEALQLLTRSNRIYLDLLQAELFSQRPTGEAPSPDTSSPSPSLDINLHLMEYFSGFDPNYEFRGFCSNGMMTSLSIYNPWIYDPILLKNKDQIFQMIVTLWKKIALLYPGKDYCLDFALNSDLTQVYLIEINAFLPPLAGSGLFNFYSPEDRNIILYGARQGPTLEEHQDQDQGQEGEEEEERNIVFRLREDYITEQEMTIEKEDPQQTGKKLTITYSPAPEAIMRFIMKCRREALGIHEEEKTLEVAQEKQKKTSCNIQ
jgi:hypothetical protein